MLPDEAQFCPSCGEPRPIVVATTAPVTSSSNTVWVAALVAVGVIGVATIAALLFVLANRNATNLRAGGDPTTAASAVSTSTTSTSTTSTTSSTTTTIPTTTTPPTLPPPSAPPAPTGLNPNSLTTDGIEPLRWGDPLSKAAALTGQVGTSLCGGNGVIIQNALPGLYLDFYGGALTEYGTDNARYQTPSGAHVGMTIAEVQAKIPYAARESGPQGTDVLAVHSEGNILLFFLESGRVRSIAAGKDGSAGFGC